MLRHVPASWIAHEKQWPTNEKSPFFAKHLTQKRRLVVSIRVHRLSDVVTQMIDPTNSTTPSVRLGEGVQKAESSHQVVQQQRLNSYYSDRDTDPPR